jgi:hypothetical protein
MFNDLISQPKIQAITDDEFDQDGVSELEWMEDQAERSQVKLLRQKMRNKGHGRQVYRAAQEF